MAVRVGFRGSVRVGTYTVAEMGQWSIDGISVELLESTSFGDEWKEYQLGIGDYGTVSFSGNFDMTDTTGQVILESAQRNKSKIGTIRFYVDNTSYYTPNITANSDAGVLMQTVKISFDKSGIGKIDFSGKCTGPMTLV
jgi:hypothetical protein